MASLRRPSQAVNATRPPQQSGPRPPLPSDAVDQRRDARKSRVGEKIKKRLSMRYFGQDALPEPAHAVAGADFLAADPYSLPEPAYMDDEAGASRFGQFGSPDFATSAFGKGERADSVPAGGGSPAEEQIRRRGAADMTREEEWSFDALGQDGVDVATFVRQQLAGADEEEVRRFQAALQRQKQNTQRELQRNVFKNYAEFVNISKEISTLENDMLSLKNLLNEWKSVPQLMGMDATLAPTLDKHGNLERRRTLRNSIVDLQHMYKQQLTQLWATVEGSQKYLPLVPGRHLVFETHNFVELNAATYKAKQSVSMFLLSDLLLIAGRRRTKTAASGGAGSYDDKDRERGRMVAENCWVLADLVVIDVKDSGDLTNALKIKRGKEVCVYRTAKPEDKKALLGAFRQVSQELSEKKRKDNEKEQERRKSMWQGDNSQAHAAASAAELFSPNRRLSTIATSLTDSKDLRWIDEYGDDLTMSIATRAWDDAVRVVEKGQNVLKTLENNPAATDLLSVRLASLRPSLVQQIAHDLSSPELRKSSTGRLVALLSRLDEGLLARDTFLKARRDLMLKRVRGIKHEGDITIYVSELAIVCFTIIRHTSDWFTHAFKDNRLASGFVTWAKEQVETFADLFRRQVYAPTIEAGVADECLRVAASHNRKLLRDVGLDFTFLLSSLLREDPSADPPPSFQLPAQTPAPGYHIEPSPFVPYVPDTPAPSAGFAAAAARTLDAAGMDRTYSDSSSHTANTATTGSTVYTYPTAAAASAASTRQAADTDEPLRAGPTAPLNLGNRSPRRARVGEVASTPTAKSSPGSPAPPPRSARRGRPTPRVSVENPESLL
ncbi:exocyst complex component exo84 [Cryptotrichosporon argae]